MANRDYCSGCIWSHDCKRVYETLGRAEGPSVVWRAVAAFLLPILVFIVSLMVLEPVLTGVVQDGSLRVLAGVAGSSLAAFAAALVGSRLGRRDRAAVCGSKETHDQ